MENDKLLHKWVNGDLSSEELEQFKNRPEYESLVALYQHTESLAAPGFDEDTMLAEILKQEKTDAKRVEAKHRSLFPTWIKYAAAASVLLFATWFFWPKNNQVTYQLARGERQEGTLPDNSTFILNAESSLVYDRKKWATERKLDLRGEAFFKVEKGATFEVRTPNGLVQVLGTQFNVNSRGKSLEVKCHSGKVALLSRSGVVIAELEANQAVRFLEGKLDEEWQFKATAEKTWIDGVSRFKKVPLLVVLNELERQYDVQIKTDAIDAKTILNCNFPHQDLDLALKTTLMPMGIQYEIKEGGKVILYK